MSVYVSCDLLSFFELLIFTTTLKKRFFLLSKLWFAFILWTTDIYNNFRKLSEYLNTVVICFHSLNYWYLQQLLVNVHYLFVRCDLLSFFELLIFTTTLLYNCFFVRVLWFAFILWTTDIYNNRKSLAHHLQGVVICFHSLNYWYLQQQVMFSPLYSFSCDLLSFFELLIFTTTWSNLIDHKCLLWFAFILWTTDIYNNICIANI